MLTPEQIAKIRAKEAATPDALKRDPLSKYTEGWFHVTLNVRDEAPVLGYITGNAEAPNGAPDEPRCILTELGRKVEEVVASIPSFHKYTSVESSIVMPNHLHMLLHLLPGGKEHLGKVIGGFMGGCSHEYWDVLGIDWRKGHPTQGGACAANHPKGAAAPILPDRDRDHGHGCDCNRDRDHGHGRAPDRDRDHTRSYRGPSLFVHGYNDVEAIGNDEIEIKRQYIRNNPRKWLITRTAPDCFRIHRNMKSANWTPERIMQGLCADRFIAADRSRQVEAWRQITTKGVRNSRGRVSATLKFKTFATATTATGSTATVGTDAANATIPVLELVGNMQLLKRPLFPLVCHRTDAHLFEQQKAAVLKVAREQGGVIVTACVSPKERDIVKILQQELLPVIEVMDNGFNEKYKPTGKAFYAVAEARRLEISPWEYEYRRREMRPARDEHGRPVLNADGTPEMEEIPDITREMCMVMNELVRLIAKREDDWWK